MDMLPQPLAALGAWNQFVCWYAMPDEARPGKMNKFPVNATTGQNCNAHDPVNWTNFQTAAAMALRWDRGFGGGVGFVLTAQDPFFCLDIDACAVDGAWSPLANELMTRLAGTAIEVSHSGTGLHLWGTYAAPFEHRSRDIANNIELYTEARFIALTGNVGPSGDAAFTPAGLAAVVAQYFPPMDTSGTSEGWTDGPCAEWSGPTDDGELIKRALDASDRNPAGAFGGGNKVSFRDLWEGNIDQNRRSESDQALAFHLAFWTGRDCARIERLMRASALLREKWDSPHHAAYLSNTILKAASGATTVYAQKAPTPAQTATRVSDGSPRPMTRNGDQYMAAPQQVAYFANCFYIIEREQVFCLDLNMVLKKSQFDVVYGGFIFTLDPEGQKVTDSAFEAFTRSRVNQPPIVNDLAFRPELPEGEIIENGLWRYVNSYVPHVCVSAPGDAIPFLNHLAKMLPVENDRAVLLHYMASFAQNPGVKFQWWPVVQGVQGNAKTLLMDMMTYLCGEHYAHLPNSHAIAKDGLKFNSWIDRKLFIGLEEIYLANKRDFLEELKPIVTNRRLAVEGKGVNAGMGDNRANGIAMTNHRDAVPIKKGDRRYAIFFCAQQQESDLLRDGMGGDYFPALYDWFEGKGRYAGHLPGKAHVAHYLQTFPLTAALDPAQNAHRAPETSSTGAAILEGLGRLEQEILDSIEEGRAGFGGGWVSGYYLSLIIEKMRVNIPHRKRIDLMAELGYIPHPALIKGRVNNPVMPDNRKPILFIRNDHVGLQLTKAQAVADAYSRAQEPVMADGAVAAFGKGPQ